MAKCNDLSILSRLMAYFGMTLVTMAAVIYIIVKPLVDAVVNALF